MKNVVRRCATSLLLVLVLAVTAAGAHEVKPILWFDQGHGQIFRVDRRGELDLSRLATLLATRGWQVESGIQPLTPELLQQVEALVLSGAFRPYSQGEIAAIQDYLRAGKRVAIMLHIGPTFGSLLHQLGVDFSNGVIRETGQYVIGDEPRNFSVTRLVDHPLTRGVGAINMFGVWALNNDGPQVEVLARTSQGSWVDLNGNGIRDVGDAQQSFGVVVGGRLGAGEFVIFGDDALFQNQFLELNLHLAENLSDWLQGKSAGQLADVRE